MKGQADHLPISRFTSTGGANSPEFQKAIGELHSRRLKANAVIAARAVLRSGSRKSDADLRAACEVLQACGDGADRNEAHMMLEALKRAPRSDRWAKLDTSLVRSFLIGAAVALIVGTIAEVAGWLP